MRGRMGEKPKIAERLSDREKDILRMVASGHTNAQKLENDSNALSALTVNTHVKNIYRKLQVRSRAQAVNPLLYLECSDLLIISMDSE